MTHQQIIVKNGVEIDVITLKAPCRIVVKAKRLIVRLVDNDIVRGMRPKVIQRNKGWLSYRVNRKYRILVSRSSIQSGPYYCLSHTEFDHWVNRN